MYCGRTSIPASFPLSNRERKTETEDHKDEQTEQVYCQARD